MFKVTKPLLLLGVICVLHGCGGGGSDGETPAPTPAAIFVNAGPDRSVNEQAEVTLSGEAQSEDESLSYGWSSTPPLTITHADTSTADAVFTAPAVTESTDYLLTLSVAGGQGGRGQDALVITVLPQNISPVAVISGPTFDGLAANTLPAGQVIVLDGSQSIDEDAADPQRQIVDWQWQQTAGSAVLAGVPTDLAQLVFTTPINNTQDSLSLTLTVTDGEGATDTESYTATVLASTDTAPTVDAGFDQFVFSGETIMLAGIADSNVPAALPLVAQWETNPNVVIDDASQADTFAIAPLVETATNYEFSLTAVDQFGNRTIDNMLVEVRPVPIPVLNDTGVVLQGTATGLSAAQENAYPRQDAALGQDRMALNNTLEKSGRGEAGFDFTALNANGDEMDDLSAPWSCVRDNTTGLIWEVKTDDGALRDRNATFSWYQTDDNGGFEGELNGSTTRCSITNCNTQSYTLEVNTAGLCGFFDWRLPTHDELMSLIHFGQTSGLKIDTGYFPNNGTTTDPALWYWSSQPGADGVSDGDGAQNAWAIDLNTGVDNFLNKSTAARVRLVRAGR